MFKIDFKLYFIIFFFIEQEEKEKAEKEKKEKEKIEREALKKAMKNERKQLRTLCKDNEYFTEDADEKVQNLTDLDRCELCYVCLLFLETFSECLPSLTKLISIEKNISKIRI